eukprot:TRINITY_DN16630_c1_g1_i1.p1 TRINITY_DN16630_c1_g1~~TRINITY_DN16630_c1_g1_i1.p1  ORF type:complete len:468 (+),score=86.70 TRINITY_DN16630_c1_g1_i1:29-1405(+)
MKKVCWVLLCLLLQHSLAWPTHSEVLQHSAVLPSALPVPSSLVLSDNDGNPLVWSIVERALGPTVENLLSRDYGASWASNALSCTPVAAESVRDLSVSRGSKGSLKAGYLACTSTNCSVASHWITDLNEKHLVFYDIEQLGNGYSVVITEIDSDHLVYTLFWSDGVSLFAFSFNETSTPVSHISHIPIKITNPQTIYHQNCQLNWKFSSGVYQDGAIGIAAIGYPQNEISCEIVSIVVQSRDRGVYWSAVEVKSDGVSVQVPDGPVLLEDMSHQLYTTFASNSSIFKSHNMSSPWEPLNTTQELPQNFKLSSSKSEDKLYVSWIENTNPPQFIILSSANGGSSWSYFTNATLPNIPNSGPHNQFSWVIEESTRKVYLLWGFGRLQNETLWFTAIKEKKLWPKAGPWMWGITLIIVLAILVGWMSYTAFQNKKQKKIKEDPVDLDLIIDEEHIPLDMDQ